MDCSIVMNNIIPFAACLLVLFPTLHHGWILPLKTSDHLSRSRNLIDRRVRTPKHLPMASASNNGDDLASTEGREIQNATAYTSCFEKFYDENHFLTEDRVSAVATPIPHHMALKTRNISTAIQFYSLLGFEVEHRFRAGPARAAWLVNGGGDCRRLELIEVPSYLLREPPGMKRQAINLQENPTMLGWNHMALDVTNTILTAAETNDVKNGSLMVWLQALNTTSLRRFGKALRIAVEPRQQIIGRHVYELAFLYDADGCLLELLAKIKDLPQSVSSGWEPWDGTGVSQSA